MLYTNCTDGELRIDPNELDNSVNETRGRLEICANNVWFSIYYSYAWVNTDPSTRALACRLLGYGDVGMFSVLCYMYTVFTDLMFRCDRIQDLLP